MMNTWKVRPWWWKVWQQTPKAPVLGTDYVADQNPPLNAISIVLKPRDIGGGRPTVPTLQVLVYGDTNDGLVQLRYKELIPRGEYVSVVEFDLWQIQCALQ